MRVSSGCKVLVVFACLLFDPRGGFLHFSSSKNLYSTFDKKVVLLTIKDNVKYTLDCKFTSLFIF